MVKPKIRTQVPLPYFLRLYRTNTDKSDNPALTVYPKDNWFVFGGQDGHLFSGAPPSGKQPWNYERLELYSDGGTSPTFVIPTVALSSATDDDFILTDFGSPQHFRIKCHMLLLNGEVQDGNSGTVTTTGLIMDLYRSDQGSGVDTYLWSGQLGETHWAPGISTLALRKINADWFNNRQPYESLDGSPGPLLQDAIAEFSGSESLSIQLQSKDVPFPTLALVFNSARQPSPYPLSKDDQGVFGLPVSPDKPSTSPNYSYRLTQRASNGWLNREPAPGSAHEEWLITLEAPGVEQFWNKAVKQYNRALATVRPVNRVTLIPYFAVDPHQVYDPSDMTKVNLRASFFVSRLNFRNPLATPGDLKIQPFKLAPHESFTNATLDFKLGDSRGRRSRSQVNEADDMELSFSATVSTLGREQDYGSFAFSATLLAPIPANTTAKIRIGSLDLEFGGAPASAPLDFQLTGLSPHWQYIPRLVADMTLPVASFLPGGQDGLPASEYAPEGYDTSGNLSEQCMDRRFTGSAPIVFSINRASNDASGPYVLVVHESNPDSYSETVSLSLNYNPGAHPVSAPNPGGATALNRVLVIDSDPFLIAAVDYSVLKQSSNSNTIALWSTGEVDGAAWQLQTEAQPFTLTLPPQVLGEEMPKAHELDAADGIPPPSGGAEKFTALDFRLGPPAVQQLQASYTPQNFVDAPWNLRRILGYPGQRDPGAGVVSLSYELLYGLSCAVDTPMLRLAEIFSILGRIPGRIPIYKDKLCTRSLDNALPCTAGTAASDPKTAETNSPAALYEQKRWQWSLYAELYNTRVGILEPRMSGDTYGSATGIGGASGPPEIFTLNSGVNCTLRPSADLYYSLDTTSPAWVGSGGVSIDDDTFPIKSTGLRGGVTWPFEAPRLFHATVRNPKSSSAIVSGLALSSLGASGTQKVGFNKDLETISSVTEIARNSKVSVASLGRIGVFHNLARYVIEYERDVVASAQFGGNQTPFAGRPVLRKVREYVEILEPIAELSNSTQTYPGAGCVKSIEFKQRIIPVLNAWSANVGDTGWKIPLWYEPASKPAPTPPPPLPPPPTPPANSFYYTLPSVVFNFAGADGADVECAVKSVDKLFFYTETDTSADPDPHAWPVVPGVDFVPVAVPQPNPAFPANSVHETPAYDPPTPFGLSAFTHTVTAGHGRVDMVHGRSAQAIGATLSSVTLQRGPQAVPLLQSKLQSVHDLVRSDLFKAIRNDVNSVAQAANKLTNSVNELQKAIDTQQGTLKSAVSDRELAALTRYNNQIKQEVSLVGDEMKAQLEVFVKQSPSAVLQDGVTTVQAQIIKLANAEIDAFFTRLDGIPAAANALGQFAVRIYEAINGAQAQLNALNAQLNAALQNIAVDAIMASTDARAQLDARAQAIIVPLNNTNALLATVRTQVQARAEAWMPAAGLVCHVWENSICGALESLQSVVTQIATLTANMDAAADDQIQDNVAQLKNAITTATGLIPKIAFASTLFSSLSPYVDQITVIPTFLKVLQISVKTDIDAAISKALSQIATPVILEADILTLATNAVTGTLLQEIDLLTAKVGTPATLILDQINNTAASVVNTLVGLLGDISAEITSAITNLTAAADSAKEAARRALESALGRYAESIVQALPSFPDGPSINVPLPSGLQVPAVLQRAFGAAPAIPNLGFSLPNVAYFYQQLLPNVSLTPLLTQVQGLGLNLSPLSTKVPSFQLLDRAIPIPSLNNFDLSSVFPDFAGLKLSNLFPALKLPDGADHGVKITHGIDTQSRQAWIQADIDLKTDTATIFSVGPMALQIATPRFQSKIRAVAGVSGQVARQTTGSITGDWQLLIGGSPMITLRATGLTFDENGKLHVDVSPDRVELSAALSFIQEIIAMYSSPDSGFGIYPSLSGIETRLSMPIPDTSLGTSGITNLTFNFLFGLSWANDFELYAGFGLASPDAPFNLAVYILGGGGHLVATARYHPGGKLACQVDMALDASAELAFSLGPISGNAHVNLGMRFIFNSGQGDLSLGIFLLIGGEVSILSIVSANILLRLDATYENGSFTCRGMFSISIKICWCFTLNVSEEVSCHLGGGSGMAFNEPMPLPWLSDSSTAILPALAVSTVPNATTLAGYRALAANYIYLIS